MRHSRPATCHENHDGIDEDGAKPESFRPQQTQDSVRHATTGPKQAPFGKHLNGRTRPTEIRGGGPGLHALEDWAGTRPQHWPPRPKKPKTTPDRPALAPSAHKRTNSCRSDPGKTGAYRHTPGSLPGGGHVRGQVPGKAAQTVDSEGHPCLDDTPEGGAFPVTCGDLAWRAALRQPVEPRPPWLKAASGRAMILK